MLAFIAEQSDAANFFRENDLSNKELFEKLRQDRAIRDLHIAVHHFISQQVSHSKTVSKQRESLLTSNRRLRLSGETASAFSKPILKATEAVHIDQSRLAGAASMDTDFFKYPTMTVTKKREEHIKRTLEWANNEYFSGGEAPDVEMEDVAV